MKKILAVLSLTVLVGGLSACNTISGAGKDIERGGEHIQNGSQNVKQKM